MRRFFGVFVMILSSSLASAQESPGPLAESNRLFQVGLAQFAEGDVSAACESFSASLRLVPRPGTLLNLGLCHEKIGALLEAQRELSEARAAAKRDGRADREALATERLAVIEAKLGWIEVAPSGGLASGPTQLRVDDVALDNPSAAIAVLPGEHRVLLEAESYEPRSQTVQVAAGSHVRVAFEPLQRSAAAAAPEVSAPIVSPPAEVAPPVPPLALAGVRMVPHDSFHTVRTTALVVGIVGLATGVATGAWALERKSAVDDRCDRRGCSPSGLDAAATGSAAALASTVAFTLGIVGFGAWVFLPGGVLNDGASSDSRAGLTVRGAF